MTMSFILPDEYDLPEGYLRAVQLRKPTPLKVEHDDIHILKEKLEIPPSAGLIERPRLVEMLERSLSRFGATLISGRAGTGKTSIAAAYAQTRKNTAWLTVESSDIDWNVFASYLSASVLKAIGSEKHVWDSITAASNPSTVEMETFLLDLFSEFQNTSQRPLVVLDGIHHLFDAEWFPGFFNVLQPSVSETADLLVMCRSKPPNPLWRLRSKQQLDVIDERTLDFDPDETILLLSNLGHSQADAIRIHAETFGRVSRLLPYLSAARP